MGCKASKVQRIGATGEPEVAKDVIAGAEPVLEVNTTVTAPMGVDAPEVQKLDLNNNSVNSAPDNAPNTASDLNTLPQCNTASPHACPHPDLLPGERTLDVDEEPQPQEPPSPPLQSPKKEKKKLFNVTLPSPKKLLSRKKKAGVAPLPVAEEDMAGSKANTSNESQQPQQELQQPLPLADPQVQEHTQAQEQQQKQKQNDGQDQEQVKEEVKEQVQEQVKEEVKEQVQEQVKEEVKEQVQEQVHEQEQQQVHEQAEQAASAVQVEEASVQPPVQVQVQVEQAAVEAGPSAVSSLVGADAAGGAASSSLLLPEGKGEDMMVMDTASEIGPETNAEASATDSMMAAELVATALSAGTGSSPNEPGHEVHEGLESEAPAAAAASAA